MSNQENFKIKNNSIAFRLLTEKLYEDPLLSTIRELVNNAYDSILVKNNYSIPKKEDENKIVIELNSEKFYIRDYGTGLSKEDMTNLYTTYFQSNKEHENETVGGFGIGSKSPLAITSEFMAISYYNGFKYSLLVFLDNNDMPNYTITNEEKTREKNGLEVYFSIPAKYSNQVDNTFMAKIERMLSLYQLKIIFNNNVLKRYDKKEIYKLKNIIIEEYQQNGFACQGILVPQSKSIYTEGYVNYYNKALKIRYKNNIYNLCLINHLPYLCLAENIDLNEYNICLAFEDDSIVKLSLSRENIENVPEIINYINEITKDEIDKEVENKIKKSEIFVIKFINSIKNNNFDHTLLKEYDSIFNNQFFNSRNHNQYDNIRDNFYKKVVEYFQDKYIGKNRELNIYQYSYSCVSIFDTYNRQYVRHIDNKFICNSIVNINALPKNITELLSKSDVIIKYNGSYKELSGVYYIDKSRSINVLGIYQPLKQFLVIAKNRHINLLDIKKHLSSKYKSDSYFARIVYLSDNLSKDNIISEEITNFIRQNTMTDIEILNFDTNYSKGIDIQLTYNKELDIHEEKNIILDKKISLEDIKEYDVVIHGNNESIADTIDSLKYLINTDIKVLIIDNKNLSFYETIKDKYPNICLENIVKKYITKNKLEEKINDYMSMGLTILILTNRLENLNLYRNLAFNILASLEYMKNVKYIRFDLFDKIKTLLCSKGYELISIIDFIEHSKNIFSNKNRIKNIYKHLEKLHIILAKDQIISKLITEEIFLNNGKYIKIKNFLYGTPANKPFAKKKEEIIWFNNKPENMSYEEFYSLDGDKFLSSIILERIDLKIKKCDDIDSAKIVKQDNGVCAKIKYTN